MRIKRFEKDRNRRNIFKIMMFMVLFIFGIMRTASGEESEPPLKLLQGEEKLTLTKEHKPAELRLEVTKLKSKELKGYIDESNKKIIVEIPKELEIIKNSNIQIYDENYEHNITNFKDVSSNQFKDFNFENTNKGLELKLSYEKKPKTLYLISRNNEKGNSEIYKITEMEVLIQSNKVSLENPDVIIYLAQGVAINNITVDLYTGAINGSGISISGTAQPPSHRYVFSNIHPKIPLETFKGGIETITYKSPATEGYNSIQGLTMTCSGSIITFARLQPDNLAYSETFYIYNSSNNGNGTLISTTPLAAIKIIVGIPPIIVDTNQNYSMDFGELSPGGISNITRDVKIHIINGGLMGISADLTILSDNSTYKVSESQELTDGHFILPRKFDLENNSITQVGDNDKLRILLTGKITKATDGVLNKILSLQGIVNEVPLKQNLGYYDTIITVGITATQTIGGQF